MSSTSFQASADSASALSEPGCEPSPSVKSTLTPEPSCASTGPTCPVTTTCEQLPLLDCEPMESLPQRVMWPTPRSMDYMNERLETWEKSAARHAARGVNKQRRLNIAVQQLMSSAGGSPARTSPTQEMAQGWPGSGQDYGRRLPVWLASYDPATSSWRTSQHCLVEGLTVFSETWPRSGMTRNGTAYQLPTLAPLTDAIGSGLWATPTAQPANGEPEAFLQRKRNAVARGSSMGICLSDLNMQVKAAERWMWPTPTARDWKDGSAKACANVEPNGLLGRVVHQWPTPRSHAGSNRRTKPTPAQLDGKAGMDLAGIVGGSLNPTWVEWLMGFPLEWTVLDALEMPSSRKSPKSSGER
jgi:hypothetical protein